MKFWISKYALTKGLYQVEAEVCSETCESMIHVSNTQYTEFYHKDEWHETKEAAIVQAEKIREKKLASLKKQIKRIEKKVF